MASRGTKLDCRNIVGQNNVVFENLKHKCNNCVTREK